VTMEDSSHTGKLSAKCAGGTTPCATLSGSGFSTATGDLRCNAQCYTVTAGRTDCSAAPTTPVDSSEVGSLFGYAVPEHYIQFLYLAVWALAGLAFVGFCRAIFCPRRGSACLINAISLLLMLVGAALSAAALVSLRSDLDLVEAYVGDTTLYGCTATGAALGLIGIVSLWGVCRRSTCALSIAFWVYVLVLLAQVGMTALLLYWIYSLDDVTNDSLNVLRGTAGGIHDGSFGAVGLKEAEGLTCRTYQTCCRDPSLDLMASAAATCMDAHEGSATDVSIAFEDVSSPNFCPYVSGARLSFSPAQGVCDVLEWAIDDFSQLRCRADFCTLALDGYFQFVRQVVEFLREYGYMFGGGFAVWTLFQLTICVNVWNIRRRFRKERRAVQDETKSY